MTTKNRTAVVHGEVANLNKKPLSHAVECAHRTIPNEQAEEITQRWEDLEEIYQSAGVAILTVGEGVKQVTAIPSLIDYVDNPVQLNILVKGLMNDLNAFTTRLTGIHGNHAGRTGVVKDGSEYVLSLQLHEHYVQYNVEFQSATFIAYSTLMEIINNALAKLRAETDAAKDEATVATIQ